MQVIFASVHLLFSVCICLLFCLCVCVCCCCLLLFCRCVCGLTSGHPKKLDRVEARMQVPLVLIFFGYSSLLCIEQVSVCLCLFVCLFVYAYCWLFMSICFFGYLCVFI